MNWGAADKGVSGVYVRIDDDFDLKKIADSGQCFRCEEIGGFWRFMTGPSVVYLKKVTKNTFYASCGKEQWESVWVPYFDLKRNYRRIRASVLSEAKRKDDFLARAAEAGSGIRILRQDPWETMITFIISQRKSIPAIRKAVLALAETCALPADIAASRTEFYPEETLFAFPDPRSLSRLTDDQLSSCGLGYRLPYVKDAAEKALREPELFARWERLPDEELLAALKSVKGIGDKVANCVMLFAFGRTARVPVDTWISRVIREEYDGRDPFHRFGENAGIVQQYAFYYRRIRDAISRK